MRSIVMKVLLATFVGILLSAGLFGLGFYARGFPAIAGAFPSLPGIATQVAPGPQGESQTGDLFAPFWEAWDIVHQEYVDQPVDDTTLMRGAISGMLDSLGDPQTSYMDPDEFRQASIPLEGSYEGIGAWVDPDAEYLTIISPMPGSPAEEAGLQPGDEVIAIDGEDMTGIDGNLVIRRVMGPAGSTVVLTIRREGEPAPFDVTIVRQEIVVPSVYSEMLEQQIAYIALSTFGENTVADLRQALQTLLSQDPQGLILDLRGNAGGYLQSSVDIASEFIDEGVILIERFGDGTENAYQAEGRGLATDIPLILLIDGGSASASEIVAGAIQDHQRGLLVGTTSYGKGSVQNWTPLSNDQGAVRVTIAHFFTPNLRPINGVGLTPDVTVELTEEDIASGNDAQLEKAIELLLQPVE
jgi:carboxyl-terminal processing protease